MKSKHNRTRRQNLRWWWETKVMGAFRLKLLGKKNRSLIQNGSALTFKNKATPLESPSDGITVILNTYKRSEYLLEQVQALKNQTVQPKEIWVWVNQSDQDVSDVSEYVDRVVVSNTNWLFWGRFALGNMVRTQYVAFFDDDILPQPRWFENCLKTLSHHGEALLGGSGVVLPTTGGYGTKEKVGWNGFQSRKAIPVDLVGHCWFFPKKLLQYMWREEPQSWENGEDIHLSYMVLKYAGVETLVPAHPEDNLALWCCRPDFGHRVGKLNNPTHKLMNHNATRSSIVDAFRDDGWVLVSERYDNVLRH